MTRKKVTRNTTAKSKAISMLARGETGREVGQALGIHESNVSRFRSKKEIRELIEQERARIIDENLSKAANNVRRLISEMENLPLEMHQARSLSYKATRDLLIASTVYPSQGNMTQINFFSEDHSEAMGSEAMKMLKRLLNIPDQSDEDIIDVGQDNASER